PHADDGQRQGEQAHGLQRQAAGHGGGLATHGGVLRREHGQVSSERRRGALSYCRLCAVSTKPMSSLDIRASMSIRISMRSATLAMPVMKLVSMAALISGADLMSSPASSSTSDTESTTAPTTRPRTLSTITTVKPLYSTFSQPSLMRRSTTGTITPR